MYTSIRVGDIYILAGGDKHYWTQILGAFLKNKIITRGMRRDKLGAFNGIEQLATKVIAHIENLQSKDKYPLSIYLYSKKIFADNYINIQSGEIIGLSDDEIYKIKSGKLDSQVYGTLHTAKFIKINGVNTIKDLDNFKVIFEERHNEE